MAGSRLTRVDSCESGCRLENLWRIVTLKPKTILKRETEGLLFLGIQALIEEQFEFLAVKWMGDPSRPKMPGGYDLLVGQNNDAKANGVRTMTIFGSGTQQASVATAAQWIVPTGGGYFFVPSLSAIKSVLTA